MVRFLSFFRGTDEREEGGGEGRNGSTSENGSSENGSSENGSSRRCPPLRLLCSTPPRAIVAAAASSARAGATTAARGSTDDSPSPRPSTRTRVSRTQITNDVSRHRAPPKTRTRGSEHETKPNETEPTETRGAYVRRVPVRPSVERAHVPVRAPRVFGRPRARPRRVSARLSYPPGKTRTRTLRRRSGRAEAFAVCATRRTARGGARTDSPSRTRRRTSP